jgi:hypothetical protein
MFPTNIRISQEIFDEKPLSISINFYHSQKKYSQSWYYYLDLEIIYEINNRP